MKSYRIDLESGIVRSRLWVDCPNMLCALLAGWWQIRGLHGSGTRRPWRSFTVTLEDA